MSLSITHIQSFSVHDGPGIRTTVFLAGCPLRCIWCHNPETQEARPTLVYEKELCIGCRQCEICPNGVHTFDTAHRIDRTACTLCGRCMDICPAKALFPSQKPFTEQEYLSLVEKQQRVIGDTGGITFSGGEPLLQGEKLLDFLSLTDIHTAIETCGYADSHLFRRVIEAVDFVMFDIKLADRERHRTYTGVPNDRILRNLDILRSSGKAFLLRTPLIPGITDTEENLEAIAVLAGSDPWEKLPYNPLTPAKYERIGRTYTLG